MRICQFSYFLISLFPNFLHSNFKKLPTPTMLPSQRIVQICLFLFAAIAISGGILQMYLGEPDTTQRLDNIHRFLAGIYLACGFICLWAAITVRQQNTLVFLIALAGLLGGNRQAYFYGHRWTSSTLCTMDHLSAGGTCCSRDHDYRSNDHK